MISLWHNIVKLEPLASGIGLGVFVAIAEFQPLASPRKRQVLGLLGTGYLIL